MGVIIIVLPSETGQKCRGLTRPPDASGSSRGVLMDCVFSSEVLARKAAARDWVDAVLSPSSGPLETEERLAEGLVA